MIMSEENRRAISKYLFQEGVLFAKKDFNLAQHPLIEGVPNLQVIKLMQSFKSKEYVRETFAWMHYYWFLTNEGIDFLRTYLNLPSEIVPATLKKQQLSHNVAKFVFELPSSNAVLGLPIGQHISCRGKDAQGEDVIKPYTPTTLDSDIGRFELVIKMYPQGRMSHHFREMRVGDHLAVKGPKGRFKYQPGQFRAFGMLAGGSGITPMFQVARAILENPTDKTKVHLIYANVTYEDILLKEELDSLTANYPDQFKIYYVLNQPPEIWDGGVGFVSKEMIQAHCPAPASDIQVLRCGPPPMNKAMAANLEALGYSPEMQFQF